MYCKNGRVMNLIQFFRWFPSILADSEKEMWGVRVGWLFGWWNHQDQQAKIKLM
jgi:hypothetical protein